MSPPLTSATKHLHADDAAFVLLKGMLRRVGDELGYDQTEPTALSGWQCPVLDHNLAANALRLIRWADR
jgi:hypothetical protein